MWIVCGQSVENPPIHLDIVWRSDFLSIFPKSNKNVFQVPHIFQFNFTDLSKRETPEFTGRAGVFLLSTAPKANKAEKIYLFLYMRNVGKEFYTYENRM